MSKKDKNQEPEMTNTAPRSFGQVDKDLTASAKEVDPFESIPTVVPGKPGFEEGETLAGKFVRTKRIYSDKFTAGKVDETTKKTYRDLHVLMDSAGTTYGIFSVGALGAAFKCLVPGDYIEVTNTGRAEKALRPGQTPPYTFSFKGVGANGGKLVFDWDKINSEDEIEAPAMSNPASAGGAPASAN